MYRRRDIAVLGLPPKRTHFRELGHRARLPSRSNAGAIDVSGELARGSARQDVASYAVAAWLRPEHAAVLPRGRLDRDQLLR
jgi:hypothetical protein